MKTKFCYWSDNVLIMTSSGMRLSSKVGEDCNTQIFLKDHLVF